MTKVIHVWPEAQTVEKEQVTVSATIEFPQASPATLWYRLPEAHQHLLSEAADAFAAALVLKAMHEQADLVIHGALSPSLLRNLHEFQAAWWSWRPDFYKRIDIKAEIEQEAPRAAGAEEAISTFSGGVDSCYTALRHRKALCGRMQRNLTTGLMVHGFDIPVTDGSFLGAMERSKPMLESLGMELLPMATNYRQVINLHWEDSFAVAIASCLHLIAGKYNLGLIPSSYSYREMAFPYGSNPVSDAFLSSDAMPILHDGAEAVRFEKIQALLAWPEALEYLRVCWQSEQKDQNCCECEKCIRNILCFRALGVGLPDCFQKDVSDEQILALKLRGASLDAFDELYRQIKPTHGDKPWVKAMAKTVRYNRFMDQLGDRFPHTWKKAIKQLMGGTV